MPRPVVMSARLPADYPDGFRAILLFDDLRWIKTAPSVRERLKKLMAEQAIRELTYDEEKWVRDVARRYKSKIVEYRESVLRADSTDKKKRVGAEAYREIMKKVQNNEGLKKLLEKARKEVEDATAEAEDFGF